MDVAGLLLAIGSVAPVCAKGYEALVNIKNFHRESTALFWRLKIEEHRFSFWAQTHGFSATGRAGVDLTSVTQPPPLATLRLIHGILSALETRFHDADNLAARYGLRALFNPVPPTLDIATHGATMSQTVSFKRLKWVLHDKKAFESLVVDLREFNNGLIDTMTALSQQNLAFGVRSEVVSAASVAKDLIAIRESVAASDEIQQIARFKELNISTESTAANSLQLGSTEISFLEVKVNMASAPTTPAKLSLAERNGQGIFIEWKYYGAGDSASVNNSVERMRRLVHLLSSPSVPAGFHTLHAQGYVHDRFASRLGIVYSLPHEPRSLGPSVSSPSKPSVTLAEALRSDRKIPILGHRIQLALVLLKAVIQLHSTGWFHKSLEASNVVFFYGNAASDVNNAFPFQVGNVDIRRPTIMGFEYSRPIGPAETSDNNLGLWLTCDAAYVHPTYLQLLKGSQVPHQSSEGRFKSEYDMFSLGCVLLEIGLWRSLSGYCKPEYLATDPTIWARKLTQKYLSELGSRCGIRYQSVVRDLLLRSGHFGGEAGSLLNNFEMVQFLESVRT